MTIPGRTPSLFESQESGVLRSRTLGEPASPDPSEHYRDRANLTTERDLDTTISSTSSNASTEDSNQGLIGLYPYSGVDIKLVVHMPAADYSDTNTRLNELLAEQESLREGVDAIPASPPSDIEAELNVTREELTDLYSLADEANPLAGGNGTVVTPEGVITLEEIEAEVVILEERRTELTRRYNQSTQNGNVAEVRQRMTELSQMIEEARNQVSGARAVTKVLAEIQTLSLSVHREKYPVRTLGSVYPRSVTRGPRCLPATEKVLVKHKGFISISEVEPGDYVQSSDSTYDKVLGSWYQGEKLCYKMLLENGYTLIGSYDHPISTSEGWINMEDLEKDDLVDVVVKAPVSNEDYLISDENLRLIAFSILNNELDQVSQDLIVNLSERQIWVFLQQLFLTDKELVGRVYRSSSENLIDQIRLLLKKINCSSVKYKDESKSLEIIVIAEIGVKRSIQEEIYISKKVLKIESAGLLPVYDLEVENRHAFIANFIRVHNTVSGSIVFTTFHNHVMHEFLESASYRSTGVGDWDRFRYTSYIMDQIPPLDISISFANEYGNLSWMAILGVEFINEGQVMSIEDLFMEGTAQYIARDFDPIRSVANRRMTPTHGVGQSLTGSDLLMSELRTRISNRNNPWV